MREQICSLLVQYVQWAVSEWIGTSAHGLKFQLSCIISEQTFRVIGEICSPCKEGDQAQAARLGPPTGARAADAQPGTCAICHRQVALIFSQLVPIKSKFGGTPGWSRRCAGTLSCGTKPRCLRGAASETHRARQHHSILLAWETGRDVPFHAVLWRPECPPFDN